MVCLFNGTAGGAAATTLDIASGGWRSRLFYQKVRVITTLSKFTVRFWCEVTEKAAIVRWNPNIPAAVLWWLLAPTPEDFHRSLDVLHLMTLDCLNTDSWSTLGVMEGRVENVYTRPLYSLKSLLRAPTCSVCSGTSFLIQFWKSPRSWYLSAINSCRCTVILYVKVDPTML